MPTTRRRRNRPDRSPSREPRGSTDKLEIVRELCTFEERLTGTDAERRAANAMAARLRKLGRKADVEPTYVHPQSPLVWALHTALAFAGSLVAIEVPAAGFAMVLVAVTSFYLDLNTQRYLLRRLFFRRASQNVVSRGDKPDAPARVLLVAHLDAARTGFIFGRSQLALARTLSRLVLFPHTRVPFWSIAVLLPIIGARMAGIDTDGLSALQLIPTLVLLITTFLLVEWQLSKIVPGANDNASGVAVALSAAAALRDKEPRNLDTWVVLTGGEECGMEGMRSFLKSHRDDLDPATTFIVVVDSVGKGNVRYTTSEGMTIGFGMDPRITQLCEAIAEADRDADNSYGAQPLSHGFATDALAASARNLRATSITCLEPKAMVPANYHQPADTPDNVDPAALDRAESFVLDLVRALDREAGR